MRLITLAALLLGQVESKDPAGKETPGRGALVVFFSEKTEGAPEAARLARGFVKAHPGEFVLRPAFLVQDWKGLGQVREESPLYRTLRALELPLQVYDEEALRLAAAWKISRLPAVALVKEGRAHVLQGTSLDLDSLLRCAR